MLNEQFTWLTPFIQLECPSFAWRTRGAEAQRGRDNKRDSLRLCGENPHFVSFTFAVNPLVIGDLLRLTFSPPVQRCDSRRQVSIPNPFEAGGPHQARQFLL